MNLNRFRLEMKVKFNLAVCEREVYKQIKLNELCEFLINLTPTTRTNIVSLLLFAS